MASVAVGTVISRKNTSVSTVYHRPSNEVWPADAINGERDDRA